jgi:hypothetical protein
MEHEAPAAPVTQSQDAEPKKRKGALTNEDVLMTHVAPCLSYMDLFSLVKTTKQMRSLLRHEHALTAVLLNADDKFGKNAKATIRNVLSLYGEGKIHKPSPMRLLRLANGKRCEFGPPCDTPDARKVVKTRPDWGLFCCWPHTVGASVEISLSKKSLKTWGATVGDPRTCQHSMANKMFLWKKPMTAADGEKIGPITTATSQHDGSAPDPTLVQLYQRLDREGRERARAALAVKADTRQKKKASKEQKIAAINATVERLAGDVTGVIGCRALVEQLDPLRTVWKSVRVRADVVVGTKSRRALIFDCYTGYTSRRRRGRPRSCVPLSTTCGTRMLRPNRTSAKTSRSSTSQTSATACSRPC